MRLLAEIQIFEKLRNSEAMDQNLASKVRLKASFSRVSFWRYAFFCCAELFEHDTGRRTTNDKSDSLELAYSN